MTKFLDNKKLLHIARHAVMLIMEVPYNTCNILIVSKMSVIDN